MGGIVSVKDGVSLVVIIVIIIINLIFFLINNIVKNMICKFELNKLCI